MEYRIALEKKRYKNYEEITELNLDNCVGTAIVGLTQEFVNLKSLSLKEVGLTSLSGLPPLPKLEIIDLSSNAISYGLACLILSPNLKSLNLSYNKIADEDKLTPLSILNALEHLCLLGNPLTDKKEYVSIVSRTIPKLKYLDSVELLRSSNKDDAKHGDDKKTNLKTSDKKPDDNKKPGDFKSFARKNSQVQPKHTTVDKHANLKKAAIIGGGVAVVVGTGVAAVVVAPLVIGAAGFTAAGVAAGSVAAAVQSSIGAVAAGSLFASLQSAGVLGLAVGTNVAIGATAGAAGGGIFAGVTKLLSKKKSNNGSANTESDDYAKPGDDEKQDGKTTEGEDKRPNDKKSDDGKTVEEKNKHGVSKINFDGDRSEEYRNPEFETFTLYKPD